MVWKQVLSITDYEATFPLFSTPKVRNKNTGAVYKLTFIQFHDFLRKSCGVPNVNLLIEFCINNAIIPCPHDEYDPTNYKKAHSATAGV